MIYTVTLNPSIDYVMRIPQLQYEGTNRAEQIEYIAGGKGINVSRMLSHLGMDTVAMGILAGEGGAWFEKMVLEYGISTEFLWLGEGNTRINVKIKSDCEMELNAPGPVVSPAEEELLCSRLSKIASTDVVVLSGSVAPGFSANIYEKIAVVLEEKQTSFVADAAGQYLLQTLKYHPLLVKPNLAELEELCSVKIKGLTEVFYYGRQLRDLGARNVMVSMGADGAVMLCEDGGEYYVPAVRGTVINSVGAGDSMVGGFLYGWKQGWSNQEILKMAVACGCASAFQMGIATGNQVENIWKQLPISHQAYTEPERQ